MVYRLLEAGADKDMGIPHPIAGTTALMLACEAGHIATARLLIEAGADLNLKDSRSRRTAFMRASAQGRLGAVQLLLDCRAETASRPLRAYFLLLFLVSGKKTYALFSGATQQPRS